LAKRCRREAVPLPPRGYWARIAAGQTPIRPPLPPKQDRPTLTSTQTTKKESESDTESKNGAVSGRAATRQSRYKSRISRSDRLETFYCSIDGWKRTYSFGVNWQPWEYNEESWSERDALEVLATIRSKTSRSYRHIGARLVPFHVEREKIKRDLDAIGNVWTDRKRKGWLLCSAFIPGNAFYSICDAVGRKELSELVIQVRNLNRGSGSTSEISLQPDLTDLSDDD
jgi:hypothetical protein